MKTYGFTLMLAGISSETDGFEDVIFEAGCDDALVCFNGKSVYLEFDREAESAEQAITSAINNLEQHGIRVVSIQEAGYVTLSGIAAMAGIGKSAVGNYATGIREEGFPNPRYGLQTGTPLYWWPEVAEWLVNNKKIDSIFLDVAKAAIKHTPEKNQLSA